MIRVQRLRIPQDFRKLERELDRIADKHNVEEPLRYMPTLDDLDDRTDEWEDDL